MRFYTPKIETNYECPYKLMLHDIREEIDYFQQVHKVAPNYVIINLDDVSRLQQEMATLKLLPYGHSGKIQYMGIDIIRSQDMSEGSFDVVGT